MRKVSRIFLYLSGAILIVAMLSTIITYAIAWLITLFNAGYNIVIIAMLLGGGDRDVVNGMLNFANFVDPIKFLLYIFGLIGAESMADGTIVGYLMVETFLGLFGMITATISAVLPMVIALAAAIIALVGARKKATRGNHVAAIIFGAMTYLYSNQMLGIFLILGGVFGSIADSKEVRVKEEEEKKEVEPPLPIVEEIE